MANALVGMGAASEATDVGRFASDLERVFARLRAVEPILTVEEAVGGAGAVQASLGVDESEVRARRVFACIFFVSSHLGHHFVAEGDGLGP